MNFANFLIPPILRNFCKRLLLKFEANYKFRKTCIFKQSCRLETFNFTKKKTPVELFSCQYCMCFRRAPILQNTSKQLLLKFEANLKQIWSKCETNKKLIWNKFEANAKRIWSRFETSYERMWNWFEANLILIWNKLKISERADANL